MLKCFLLFCLALSACGRYGPPLYPAKYSPVAVKELQTNILSDGIEFKWSTPELDQRGENLDSIDGYNVYRAEVDPRQFADSRAVQAATYRVLSDNDFSVLTFVEDTSLLNLQTKKEEARKNKIPLTELSSIPEPKTLHIAIPNSSPGKIYLYKIVPLNQGKIEGEYNKVIRLRFAGLNSKIDMVETSALADIGAMLNTSE